MTPRKWKRFALLPILALTPAAFGQPTVIPPKPSAARVASPGPQQAAGAPSHAQINSASPTKLNVGPIYTSADAASAAAPQFPRIKIVLRTNTLQQTMPQAGDLTLLENGSAGPHALEVSSFESTGYGVAAAMAIDVSGSMTGRPLQIIRESLYKFVSDARPQDRFGVLTIADDARWDVPFGSDKETLRTRLQRVQTRGHKTLLYDSLITALSSFNTSLPARRELTVISDGHDEGSQHSLQDVIRAAEEKGVPIDAIGMTRSSPAYLRTLSDIASGTGGTFRQVASDEQLQALISNGMAALKASPVATFEARNIAGDGKSHQAGVRWQGHPDLVSETEFTTPLVKGGFLRWCRNLPDWAYPLAAFAFLAIIFGLVMLLKGSGKRAAPPATARQAPAHGVPPIAVQAPTRAETTMEVDAAAHRYEPHSPPAAERVPPPINAPERAQPAQPKRTRMVGLFPAAEGVVAHMEGTGGPLAGARIEVRGKEFWIGAARENDLSIADDPTVSSRHACLISEDRLLLIADNHSTNGTRVNEVHLRGTRRPLQGGDQIQIGRSTFVISPAV